MPKILNCTDGVSLSDNTTNTEFLIYKHDVHFILSLTSQVYRVATVHSRVQERNKMWAHCSVYKLTSHNTTLYKLPANSEVKDSIQLNLGSFAD